METQDDTFNKKTETPLQSLKKQFSEKEKVIPINKNKIWMRIAASIIIVFGMSYYFYNNSKSENLQFASISSGENIKEIKLADGSVIWLNKNSKLEYPEKFAKKNRVVKMTGEAYFIIAHNKQKPFIVKTENTTTEVLGTEFNLKSFDNEQNIEIVLKKGKVKFTDSKSKVSELMKPNDRIVLNKKERKIKKETVLNSNFLSWKTKVLDLNNMNLEEIAKTLSEYYNVEIKADNSVKNEIFNSTMPFKDVGLDKILKILEVAKDIEIDSVNGKTILTK
jgi:ferric-dicitrate binding protein FerR (iron transport regulator)